MAESDASLDAQLDLKKRARRRLVGAAALALLAAIVLPMVMDREPRPTVQDIQVRIPSQDAGGFTSRILPPKPAATPLPPAETVVDTKPENRPSVPEGKPETAKASIAAKPVDKSAEKPVEKPADKAPAKPVDKPSEKAPDKTPDKPLAAKADEARAAAALSGAATGGGEQWVVQLGAYKEPGNVKLLVAKIKQLGLPVYTENFESPQGPRVRVRAGPFPSKDAAEKAQGRVKIIGVQGPVAPK